MNMKHLYFIQNNKEVMPFYYLSPNSKYKVWDIETGHLISARIEVRNLFHGTSMVSNRSVSDNNICNPVTSFRKYLVLEIK